MRKFKKGMITKNECDFKKCNICTNIEICELNVKTLKKQIDNAKTKKRIPTKNITKWTNCLKNVYGVIY